MAVLLCQGVKDIAVGVEGLECRHVWVEGGLSKPRVRWVVTAGGKVDG